MKVLQINSHYNSGGAGKIVAYLHHELLNSGFESVVIYGRGEQVTEPNVYRIGSDFSNKVDGIITRLVGSAGFQSWGPTKQAIEIIEREKPDILHLHGLHGYYLNYRILFEYINKTEIPCVWTFHDCLAFTGKCGYPYDCKKYISGCNHCKLLKDYPTTYGFDLTKSMWNKKKKLFTGGGKKIIVSPSKWMTSMAKSSFFGKYECLTINNGIDVGEIFQYRDKNECRLRLGLPMNKPIALAVAFGQENPRKGVKYIIQAAQDMPEIKFVIIGCKIEQAERLSRFKNIITKEFTTNQLELAYYYSGADIFLIPSLAENYATTVIESLACGTPVVGFNVGGIPEQAYGICGTTVEACNQELFNREIFKWAKTAPITAENRYKISRIASERNSMGYMFQQYLTIYRSLLE